MAIQEANVIVDLQADAFQSLFYETLDYHRSDVAAFYQETSTVLWNGTRITSAAAIDRFFKEMPVSKHTVTSYDIQPMADDLLVTVAGNVRYGIDQEFAFHQTFILQRDRRNLPPSNRYFIVLDTFRCHKQRV
ncbi:NTF2-related export protein [Plasmodiophora brassicae]|uniref:NTF2-related export protein n=1 Tax=Plasmodiophora brassicae TaxID=37360 RepID=A0A0G4IYN0_PLABS|nr:hypothetical protein PBRA_001499 [Plasmodiophora brassicae]SPQ94052.1 unnamed protein product [Plasmodiophora brassicae]